MPVLGPTFKAMASKSTWNPVQKEAKTSEFTNDVRQTTYSTLPASSSSSSQWDTYGEQKLYYTMKMEKSTSEETKDNYGTSTSTQYFSHRLPTSQSPTITLLKKAREGQIPKGAAYIETKKEDKKYEGIGPTERGLPIGLRTNVKDEYRTDWYRSMYNSLHKPPHRTSTGAHPSGYTSEPEITSESSRRYATLDSSARLHRSTEQHRPLAEQEEPKPTTPNPYLPNEQANIQEIYRNQPRSIAEYEPGHSSLATHERLMIYFVNKEDRAWNVIPPHVLLACWMCVVNLAAASSQRWMGSELGIGGFSSVVAIFVLSSLGLSKYMFFSLRN